MEFSESPLRGGLSVFMRADTADVYCWHLADKATAPAFVRYWTIVDKAGFWPGLSVIDPKRTSGELQYVAFLTHPYEKRPVYTTV
jgi:hypothetical protein